MLKRHFRDRFGAFTSQRQMPGFWLAIWFRRIGHVSANACVFQSCSCGSGGGRDAGTGALERHRAGAGADRNGRAHRDGTHSSAERCTGAAQFCAHRPGGFALGGQCLCHAHRAAGGVALCQRPVLFAVFRRPVFPDAAARVPVAGIGRDRGRERRDPDQSPCDRGCDRCAHRGQWRAGICRRRGDRGRADGPGGVARARWRRREFPRNHFRQ